MVDFNQPQPAIVGLPSLRHLLSALAPHVSDQLLHQLASGSSDHRIVVVSEIFDAKNSAIVPFSRSAPKSAAMP